MKDFIVYIDDMLDAIEKGISFVENINLAEFSKDDKTQFAVIRAIEIIGEASKKIPKEIKLQYSEIPWKEISGMRDKLIHDYFGINIEVVWKTVEEDFQYLNPRLQLMKKELDL
ncbi:MAG: DUF86 domain-containing protein [Chlorobi bacterium]|nr:DUF86 domain-containing protein [Chlorobiota bacterium]